MGCGGGNSASSFEVVPWVGENYICSTNTDYQKQELTRMKRLGVDVAVLFGGDVAALSAVNSALNSLGSAGQPYPSVAFFEDLGATTLNNTNYETVKSNLIAKVNGRLAKIDDRFVFKKEGKILLWINYEAGQSEQWYRSRTDSSSYADNDSVLERKFCDIISAVKQSSLKKLYVVAPTYAGKCAKIDAYFMWGDGLKHLVQRYVKVDGTAATGPTSLPSPDSDLSYYTANLPVLFNFDYNSNKKKFCEVSPGYERDIYNQCVRNKRNQPGGDPDKDGLFGKIPLKKSDATYYYTDSMAGCQNSDWVVIQTWNEFFESSAISRNSLSGDDLEAMTADFARIIMGKTVVVAECLPVNNINSGNFECYQDGTYGYCGQNNRCVFSGDINFENLATSAKVGSDLDIRWRARNNSNQTVYLRYKKVGSQSWINLNSSSNNVGTYRWRVAESLASGDYEVKVESGNLSKTSKLAIVPAVGCGKDNPISVMRGVTVVSSVSVNNSTGADWRSGYSLIKVGTNEFYPVPPNLTIYNSGWFLFSVPIKFDTAGVFTLEFRMRRDSDGVLLGDTCRKTVTVGNTQSVNPPANSNPPVVPPAPLSPPPPVSGTGISVDLGSDSHDLQAGSDLNVTWTDSMATAKLYQLLITRNGQQLRIGTVEGGGGGSVPKSFSWQVGKLASGTNIAPGAGYKIKVCRDTSNNCGYTNEFNIVSIQSMLDRVKGELLANILSELNNLLRVLRDE